LRLTPWLRRWPLPRLPPPPRSRRPTPRAAPRLRRTTRRTEPLPFFRSWRLSGGRAPSLRGTTTPRRLRRRLRRRCAVCRDTSSSCATAKVRRAPPQRATPKPQLLPSFACALPHARAPPPLPVQGNVDETMYCRVPDPEIALTRKGHAQAADAGRAIRDLCDRDGTPYKLFFVRSRVGYRGTLALVLTSAVSILHPGSTSRPTSAPSRRLLAWRRRSGQSR
jgi:hypothetical protein